VHLTWHRLLQVVVSWRAPEGSLAYSLVRRTFLRLRTGIPFIRRPPRLHDLRHTLASRVLQRWLNTRRGAVNRILILSRYLGHRNVEATYWHLTALPQLLAEAAQRFDPNHHENS
jgi:integrase